MKKNILIFSLLLASQTVYAMTPEKPSKLRFRELRRQARVLEREKQQQIKANQEFLALAQTEIQIKFSNHIAHQQKEHDVFEAQQKKKLQWQTERIRLNLLDRELKARKAAQAFQEQEKIEAARRQRQDEEAEATIVVAEQLSLIEKRKKKVTFVGYLKQEEERQEKGWHPFFGGLYDVVLMGENRWWDNNNPMSILSIQDDTQKNILLR